MELLVLVSPEPETEEEREELLEDEPLLRPRAEAVVELEGLVLAGKMRERECVFAGRKVVMGPDRLRENFGNVSRHSRDEEMEDAPEHFRAHRADALVDRHDASRMGGVVLPGLDELVLRVLDLGKQGEPVALEFSVDEDPPSGSQRVLEIVLIEPDDLELAGVVLGHGLDDAEVPATRGLHPQRHDLDFDGRLLTGLEIPHREPPTAVFVAEGKILEEVVDRSDSRRLERRGLLGADALHVLDGSSDVEHESPGRCGTGRSAGYYFELGVGAGPCLSERAPTRHRMLWSS